MSPIAQHLIIHSLHVCMVYSLEMLDEPTNHLDLEAVLWLEAHLKSYPHTVITVSHDRGFLNEVCTDTIDFKDKKLTYYRGNYDNFVKLKGEKQKNQMREYEAYKVKRDHMMEFIEKFRANAKRATIGKLKDQQISATNST